MHLPPQKDISPVDPQTAATPSASEPVATKSLEHEQSPSTSGPEDEDSAKSDKTSPTMPSMPLNGQLSEQVGTLLELFGRHVE